MCGIVGALRREIDIERALKILRRRGPDDSGAWACEQDSITLGHTRLSIIDTSSAGHQPMVSPDGRVVMVFNGEIYNYRELRRELESAGDVFFSQSDSEVLLALFCRHGEQSFARLNGIFTAAFWDREAKKLWIVRDPLGVKPLYYHEGSGGFAFSSELKALVRLNLCPATLDRESVLAHLGYLWAPGERTIVEGIRKLLPGEALCIGARGVEKRWFYSDIGFSSERHGRKASAIAVELADAVHAAVKRQMISDVPLGAFLSGGLDSSAVVAFAARELRGSGKLQCFSIRIQDDSTASEGFADDLPFATRVAKHLDVDLHVVDVDSRMMARLPEMIYLLDEPTPDPAALNTLFISELARKHEIKVLLSGAGGDDIFTGYRRHYALTQEQWWGWWPKPLRRGLAALGDALPVGGVLGRRISKAFHYAGLSADQRLSSYFLWLDPVKALSLLTPEFKSTLSPQSLWNPLAMTLDRLPIDQEPLNRMLYLECKHFLADHNLNYTDKMGMAAGVEVRVPLLDLDLVKFAGSLPVNLKQRGSVGKWIFKKAMEPYLPRDIIFRPKTGFGVPLRRWLHGLLKPLVDEVLSEKSLRNRGVFDFVAVQRLLNEDRGGVVDASYTIFGIVCLELWCRQYIDGAYALDAGL